MRLFPPCGRSALTLSDNAGLKLTSAIEKLTNLKELYVSGTDCTAGFPSWVTSLKSLTYVVVQSSPGYQ